MKTLIIRSLAISFLIIARSALAQSDESKRLHELFEQRFEWELMQFPGKALARGDDRYADRIADESIEAIEMRHNMTADHFDRLTSIDRSRLDEQDLINYELFELTLRNAVDGHRFRTFLAPIGGRFGPQQSIPQMHERVPFNTIKDYRNYMTRLEQVPQQADAIIERMKLGIWEDRVPPKVTLLGVPGQFETLLAGGLEVLATPFDNMPETINDAQAKLLRHRFDTESYPAVIGAIQKLADYFNADYLPNCRETIAATDWPDGEAYYNHQIRVMTTSDLRAREIHQIGLREVARIRDEMLTVIKSSDFMTIHEGAAAMPDDELFAAFINYLRTDDRFYHETPKALLDGYRIICKRIDEWMPRLFKTLPRLAYGIKEIPSFMAPSQTTGYYSQGNLDNAEPGYFYANTYNLKQRPTYEMIPLALHEAVPGHHHQISLAQELHDVPEFRKEMYLSAFGEGWGLYSEHLGLEMGLYDDPYDNFGRLTYEMWRACRLVVDPGMHVLGWSRARAIQYMLDNSALTALNITTEVDRYIAWPGQAVSYKIGELKIRELRKRAEETLGEKFDLREFHDVVLGAGAVPLYVLERRVYAWLKLTPAGMSYD